MEERRKYLLGREEVKPDKPDNRGQTPLPNAARRGFKDMVEIFLEREEVTPTIQIITVEHRCRILLRKENKGAVKILLGRGEVHPQKLANDGRTPLKWAPTSCDQEIQALSQPYE